MTASNEARAAAIAAARAAAAKQATEILILDVSEVLVIADLFVLCTVSSPRQAKTVVDEVGSALRGVGVKPVRREGEDGGWLLLDYVDVVVHVFGEEEREYYDLERLWQDAPRVTWDEPERVSSG